MSVSQKHAIRVAKTMICILLAAGFYACPAVGQVALPVPDHIVIVIEENKSFGQMMKAQGYLHELINQGASLTQMYAFHHPSQQNYYELFSGSDQHISGDTCPPFPARSKATSLGGILLKAFSNGFAGYAEDLPHIPSDSSLKAYCGNKPFALKHTPWLGFEDSFANTHDFSEFPRNFSDLPKVAMVIPNLKNDMHDPVTDGATATKNGIARQEKNIKPYVDWAQTHNSLLIITWDEDNGHTPHDTTPPQNRIATVFVGAMVKPCSSSDVTYNHHDLLRTIEDMYSLQPIGDLAASKDIVGIWNTNSASDPPQPCLLEEALKSKTKGKDKKIPKSNPEKPN